MACEYNKDRVKTADGLTPEHMWRGFLGIDMPDTGEFMQWKDLAEKLRDDAFRTLYELGDVETALAPSRKPGDAIYPRYQAMREIYAPLNEQVRELDNARSIKSILDEGFVSLEHWVGKAAQVSIDLDCLQQQLEAEIRGYGVTPSTTPTPTPAHKGPPPSDGMGILGTAAVIAAGVGAVWLAIAISRRGSAAPKEGT